MGNLRECDHHSFHFLSNPQRNFRKGKGVTGGTIFPILAHLERNNTLAFQGMVIDTPASVLGASSLALWLQMCSIILWYYYCTCIITSSGPISTYTVIAIDYAE